MVHTMRCVDYNIEFLERGYTQGTSYNNNNK